MNGAELARTPKTNVDYWIAKIARNRARDRRNAAVLRKMGWRVVTIWECDALSARARKLKRAVTIFQAV